jgi:hypothetical protein
MAEVVAGCVDVGVELVFDGPAAVLDETLPTTHQVFSVSRFGQVMPGFRLINSCTVRPQLALKVEQLSSKSGAVSKSHWTACAEARRARSAAATMAKRTAIVRGIDRLFMGRALDSDDDEPRYAGFDQCERTVVIYNHCQLSKKAVHQQ